MRIFVTGATGFIGSATVKELIAAGHEVIGLSRTAEKARALTDIGVEVVEGSTKDTALLSRTAARADGVIHLAFNHDDFTRFKQNCEEDRPVIAALAEGLGASGKPLIITSGTPIAQGPNGEIAREGNPIASSDHHPRAATEEAGLAAVAKGVNVSVVRLPQVHDPRRQGLITPVIHMFRDRGACFYIGDGANRWPAAHHLDVARLYRLAVERAEPNAKYHAVAEEGVAIKPIVETIGERLGLPVKSIAAEEAPQYFGWMAMFAGLDMPASSEETRRVLGWQPVGPGLIADLDQLVVE
jgi:nucleoside-diphosphate-sugar epimerase